MPQHQQVWNEEQRELLSAYTRRTCEEAFAYAMSRPTQQTDTTKGTLFGAYNAVTGYFQNVRTYKNGEVKLKSHVLGGNSPGKNKEGIPALRPGGS